MSDEKDVRSPPISAELESTSTTLRRREDGHCAQDRAQNTGRADVELGSFAGVDHRRHKRGETNDVGAGDSSDEDRGEDEHLLGNETAALNYQPDATTRQPDDGEPPAPAPTEKAKPVAWSSLPKKGQLAILTLARLSEPLTQTSLISYMFYQLKSFTLPSGEPPSDSTVAQQAGLLAAAFTGAQFLTAIMWGRLADSERLGRKKVILIGLLGTAIGSLGFGFSRSFPAAVFWRCVGGMLNGNMGVMRTMISEIVREKKFQSRAFLLLPMTFNIGVIIGPLLGGFLADPVATYPSVFGPGGSIGGESGVGWLTKYPYALPNVITASFLFGSAMGILFGLEETLYTIRDRPDYAVNLRKWVFRTIARKRSTQEYNSLPGDDRSIGDVELQTSTSPRKLPPIRQRLPFRRIWTTNLLFTLLAHGLLAMHVGTFNNIWFVFLSTPRYDSHTPTNTTVSDPHTLKLPPEYHPHPPLTFTGGLALPPASIGTALSILGVIGISMQLILFPRISFKLGTVRSFRLSLLLFPLSYTLTPFLSVVPSSQPPPSQATGALVWIAITIVLIVQVTARTFALPSTAILVNNSSPHPSVLGTVHGIAQSVSSATRTIGPVLAGWIYGVGLNKGVVGLVFWCMAGAALVGAIAGRFVKEGDGHEIWLEGEQREKAKG